MSMQIDDIIDELFSKHHGISREDINRIIKSQFRTTRNTINEKSDTTISLMYIGKYKPTPFRIKQLKSFKDEHNK